MSFAEGMEEFKAKRYEEAVKFFIIATDKDDKNHKAWNALGVCYSSLGRYEEADRCFRTAVGIYPESSVYLNNRMKNKRKIPSRAFAWEDKSEAYVATGNGYLF